jgi:hypothetical protein
MAKTKRLPQQVIKVKNYGNDWLNRLAVVSVTLEKMEPNERAAALKFFKSLFSKEWPSDLY